MTNLAEPIIYSLPYPAVSPSENAILNSLLSELQSLKEEVAQLRDQRDQDQHEIQDLRQQLEAHEDRLRNHGDRIAGLTLAQDDIEATLTKPTEKPAEPTEKTTDHINQLARVMTEDRRHAVSVAVAARLLGISKERMRQLKPLLLADGRFELGWDRQRGQKKRVVIRLKQFIK